METWTIFLLIIVATVVVFGFFIVIDDYLVYRDLQRRLRKEKERRDRTDKDAA